MVLKNKITLAMCGLALASVGFAANASAIDFDGTGLSEDGKFHFDMAPPSNEAEKQTLSEYISDATNGEWGLMGWENSNPVWKCKEGFAACKLVNLRAAGWEWTDDYYDIVFEYDPVADAKIDAIVDNFSTPEAGFLVSDNELMKYWAFGGQRLAAVSSQVKTALENVNLDFVIDVRAGARDDLWDEELGMGKVYYDGVLYAVIGGDGFGIDPYVVAPHIFYVESGTEDLVQALMNRIVAIYGDQARNMIGIQNTGRKVSDYIGANNKYYNLFKDNLNANVFEMNISQGQLGDSYLIAIVADSDKLEDYVGINSTDLLTDINIYTAAKNLPGDAKTWAENLGSDVADFGEDFAGEYYAYEIGLYSEAMDSNITDSDDGFEVSIPVPDNLKGVEYLSAYWKSFETGTLEEHIARIVDGNAIFSTNHFSTYVLAESMTKPQEPDVAPDTPTVPSAPNTGANAKGLNSVATSLPLFGAIFAVTGIVAVVFSRRR